MMHRYIQLITLFVLMLSASVSFADSDIMKPYPLPEAGYDRMVIHLEPLANEDLSKVELLIGKIMEVDCNLHSLSGMLESETIVGWGYSYYILRNAGGPAASTRMTCPPGEEKKEAFVQVRGDGHLLRYNSKLPIVVYVPTDFEVRYRIWAPGEESREAIAE
jgi:ecotin